MDFLTLFICTIDFLKYLGQAQHIKCVVKVQIQDLVQNVIKLASWPLCFKQAQTNLINSHRLFASPTSLSRFN